VAQLQNEGIAIELIMVQGLPNTELHALMQNCDVIADQLLIGWYAMFAIEAMALGKPVLCYTRTDLENLYVQADLLEPGELPLINCNPSNIVEVIRKLVNASPSELTELGERGRAYVERRHSLDVIGRMFDVIHADLKLRRDV
jgi:glycosyltransferase involved in cell wall biosynthesis